MIADKILEEYRLLQTQIKELQTHISKFPPGKLICCQGSSGVKWYHSDGHSRVYIPKSNRALAEQLATKKYLSLTLEHLQQEKTALEFYLRHHAKQEDKAEKLLTDHPGYQELLSPYFKPKSSVLAEWMHAPYDKNMQHPENLLHKTSSGIYVRSKSEAMIALFLHTNHIPFRYECALNLGGITIHPDFTIIHPETSKIFYWEHFGRMDDNVYIQNTYSKLQLYTTHGLVPSIHLITTYETREHPLSYEEIARTATTYFL